MRENGTGSQILLIPNQVSTLLENLSHYIALYVFGLGVLAVFTISIRLRKEIKKSPFTHKD